jgi:hypothetical protein
MQPPWVTLEWHLNIPLVKHASADPAPLLSKLGSADRQFVLRHIAEYLVQAWDVRNTCKHSGAVFPFPSAPVGRGVDGIDAMA